MGTWSRLLSCAVHVSLLHPPARGRLSVFPDRHRLCLCLSLLPVESRGPVAVRGRDRKQQPAVEEGMWDRGRLPGTEDFDF